MISLFIDTSLADVSIALVKDRIILAKKVACLPNEHSIYAVSYLNEILETADVKAEDVDNILVVNGPGSFTGVRIGVTIAKVFAYILRKDIICLSSLKIRALSVDHDYCLSLISANRGNYYVGLYDKDNNEIVDEQFNNLEYVKELIEKYNPVIVVDNDVNIFGIDVIKNELDIIKIVDYYKSKRTSNVHLVVPNYLKLPQALEEKR